MTALWALPAVASALLAIGDPLVVIDLNPGPGGSEPGPLVPLGNGVVFSAYVRGVGREIFVSDGTAAGTRLIADLVPGPAGSDPLQLTALGNEVYFLARDERGHYGRLYATDGTGVRLVRALALGFLSAVDNPMVGGRLLFGAEDGIVSLDPVTGLEELLSSRGGVIRSSGAGRALASGYWNGGLLVTNGTAKGTLEIEGLLPGGITVPYLGKIAILTRPVNVEDYDDYRNFRILVTDGTDSGTRFLPFDGARIVGAAGRNLVLASMQDSSVFAVDERDRTRPLGVHVFDGAWAPYLMPLLDWGLVNGRLFFPGGRDPSIGEPFGTDGSSAELLGDLVPGPLGTCSQIPVTYLCRGASLPHNFMEAGRVTYFVAGEEGRYAVWRTDGTLKGTTPITAMEHHFLKNPVLGDQGIFIGVGHRELGYEPAFLPLQLPKGGKVPVAPCPLWSSNVLPGTRTNVEVEGRCGVPVGAYSVQIDLAASFPERTASTVRLAASGAVPPAAATRFFGPKASRATQTVNIGPQGITVWNDGPGAIRVSLNVVGYEAPER